jgi:hypothetical protein
VIEPDALGVVAGLAGAADVRADGIDGAPRLKPDLADQGQAPVAVATHAALPVVDELARDAFDLGIVFEREARPFTRVGAAGAAGEAGRRILDFASHVSTDGASKRKWAATLRQRPTIAKYVLFGLDVADGDLAGPAIFLGVERHLLAFPQAMHAGALESRGVYEDILAAVIRRDESEALLVVVKLHCAFSHFTSCSFFKLHKHHPWRTRHQRWLVCRFWRNV